MVQKLALELRGLTGLHLYSGSQYFSRVCRNLTLSFASFVKSVMVVSRSFQDWRERMPLVIIIPYSLHWCMRTDLEDFGLGSNKDTDDDPALWTLYTECE